MDTEGLYRLFLESEGVTTDSRKCGPGLMFFALRGERFNGNEFAAEAISQGCICAVIDDPVYADASNPKIILVGNVLLALQQMACLHRRTLGTPVIGITGTNGKTTTKELLAAVMGSTCNILYTQGNLNNSIGVPLTVLNLKKEHQYAIVEMGASHPGDIKELVDVCRPNYGLITNVGKAHLLGFGSFEGVMATKGELYDFLRQNGGKAFVNRDNQWLQQMSAGLEKTEYGRPGSEGLAVEGEVTACDPFLSFRWRKAGGQWHEVHTKLIGSYNVDNALAAVTVGLQFGVAEEAVTAALEAYAPKMARSQLVKTDRNTLVVDAYNANPTSMLAALDNFRLMKADAPLLILGDMRELGDASASEHLKIVDTIRKYGFKEVLFVGQEFTQAAGTAFRCFPNVDELNAWLKANPVSGKTVLIKGSNSIGLTKTVENL